MLSSLPSDLNADQVLYADHTLLTDFIPEAYQKILVGIVDEYKPRAVIFGHTTIGMDIVGGMSAQLSLPLVSSVRYIEADNKLISQICGGKIMAECDFPESTTLITMVPGGYKPELGHGVLSPPVSSISFQALDSLRTSVKQYIEPETGDVDISKEPLLIAVGRGIQNQDNISLAEDLAQVIGGIVCASRPVVDQGDYQPVDW